jgi:hypothetical protein
MTSTVHVWHEGGMKTARKFWSENPKERDHLKDMGVNGGILTWISEKQGARWCIFNIYDSPDQHQMNTRFLM